MLPEATRSIHISGISGKPTIWLFNSLPRKIPMLLIGKPSINGPFSMAMLNNQRVVLFATICHEIKHPASGVLVYPHCYVYGNIIRYI